MKKNFKNIEYEESCGNIFADLGLENAEEMLAKSRLAIMIKNIIEKRKLTQTAAGKIIGAHQTQLARLDSGEALNKMSLDLLMRWLTKLGNNITVSVVPTPVSKGQAEHKQHEGVIQVAGF